MEMPVLPVAPPVPAVDVRAAVRTRTSGDDRMAIEDAVSSGIQPSAFRRRFREMTTVPRPSRRIVAVLAL
jgi:hypothetical protein